MNTEAEKVESMGRAVKSNPMLSLYKHKFGYCQKSFV